MDQVFGDWKTFTIKLIEPEDHPKILEHLCDFFGYPALYRLNYDKIADDEMSEVFKAILEGPKLSLYAEDKAIGKVAGTRIVYEEKKNIPEEDRVYNSIKNPILRSIMKFYMGIMDDGHIFETYPYDVIPHMFALSTAPDFQRQGLGTEMYRRSKLMLRELGHKVAIVGFISPYSRAAGLKNGFKETSRRLLVTALNDETGEPLNPTPEPADDFLNMGVFEL